MKISIYFLLIISAVGCAKQREGETDIQGFKDQRIYDNASLLSSDEENKLNKIINELENNIGSQIAVVIIDSLINENIDVFSLRTAEKMNLGRSEFNDGLLIAVAMKEHEVKIEVGLGLERIIKDEIAAQIIRNDIVPNFKNKNYYQGIHSALVKIIAIITDNKKLIGKAH